MNGLITDNETGDLLIENKTAVVTTCEEQVVETVLLSMRGEIKEFPLLGAELRLKMGGNRDAFWPLETKKMIRACGVDVEKVEVDADGVVTIQ